jgi:hypothetical protein
MVELPRLKLPQRKICPMFKLLPVCCSFEIICTPMLQLTKCSALLALSLAMYDRAATWRLSQEKSFLFELNVDPAASWCLSQEVCFLFKLQVCLVPLLCCFSILGFQSCQC